MKKLIIFLIPLLLLFACTKDVVTNYPPVSENDWRTDLVKKLQDASNDSMRNVIMSQNGTRLTSQLISFLRQSGYNCQIDTILYRYGSGNAKNVSSGDGHENSGHFNSQPYAVVKGGKCFKDWLYVFILCFNGTFSLGDNTSVTIGGNSGVFVIKQGQGINAYVDYPTSIWLAEYFKLPLYKGKGWKKKQLITPNQARMLDHHLGETQVTVKVFPGDTFNLGRMTLNGKK